MHIVSWDQLCIFERFLYAASSLNMSVVKHVKTSYSRVLMVIKELFRKKQRSDNKEEGD